MRAANGYTQKMLADMVHVQGAAISKLETDQMEPSDSLLRALCEVLKVKPSFFERPVEEPYAIAECSFRHLQSTSHRLLDEALAKGALLHEAVNRLSLIAELPPPNIPDIPAQTVEEIERAAESARALWGLGLRAPILNVIRVAEHAGVVVTRLRGSTEKVDAFSRYGDPPTIVLTSVRGSTSLDRFNVAHELGHLVIHRGEHKGDFKTEREANRFAAAFLLPAEVFREEFRSLDVIDWPHLFEMKRRWKVAGSGILHRAEELGLLSAVEARRLYKQHSWRGWNKGEPYEPAAEHPELLTLALEVAVQEQGEDLREIASSLGWEDETTEAVTGFSLPRAPEPTPTNLTRIDQYRRDK